MLYLILARLLMPLVLTTAIVWTGACTTGPEKAPNEKPQAVPALPEGGATTASPTTPIALKLLRTNPERGPVGTGITITGEGLTPGETVELTWATVEGTYETELLNNRVVFRQRQFAPIRISLGTATIDSQGKLTATLKVPEDYGEIHDIYVTADGQDVAKGGFMVTRSFNVAPGEGPVGTVVTVEVKGLGVGAFNSTMAARYDNKYMGWVSATTTRGIAKAQFRAAGPVGKHLIELLPASHLTPYINIEQSSFGHLLPFRDWFTVTQDDGAPALAVEWPDIERMNRDGSVPRTIVGLVGLSAPAARGTLSPGAGPVGSQVRVEATGLPAGVSVELIWVSVTGSDLFGWNLFEEPLAVVTVSSNGVLDTTVQIPESLGGWHVIWVKQGDSVLTEAPFFVQRSLIEVAPSKVKVGEVFKVQIKGVGWTDLDNGMSITYDNGFIGYACGFSSGGDVTLYLVATGDVGTHLIDLYPMIYDSGKGGGDGWPWQYNMPQLTALEDHPSLGLGYRLPVFRLAIEVVE